MKTVKFTCRWAWRFALAGVLFLNIRLYNSPPLPASNQEIGRDLLDQLRANSRAISNGAPHRMQQLFPEGAYFCYVLHGLTWIEAALRDPSLTQQAIDEAKNALAQIESEECRSSFPPELPPDHGMFYSAWKAHLQSGVVLLQNGNNRADLTLLRRQCNRIAQSITDAETPFLPSYRHSVWPCDTLPGIHAIAICDHVTQDQHYDEFVDQWIIDVTDRLDPETGLIPHTVRPIDGYPNQCARSTSQSIILRMLPDIAPQFSKAQYDSYREQFLDPFAGIPCVREFPPGISGHGDIDSGPLVFDRCLSGTVFTMGLAQIFDDPEIANSIATVGEAIGMPWTHNNEKYYAAGALPIGDIMVTYSQNARCWLDGSLHQTDNRHPVSTYWRWTTHLLSCLFLAPMIVGIWRKQRQRLSTPDDLIEATEPKRLLGTSD